MKHFSRRLVLPVLLAAAAFIAPSPATAAPINDNGPGWDMPAYGGTNDTYTQGATPQYMGVSYGNMSPWGWDMFYTWTAPIAGTVRFDLCQTSPGIGGEWYIAAWNFAEGPSPFSYDVATATGCAGVAMPQGDFNAISGKKYQIVIGGRHTQNVLALLRITYLPQVAAVPTIAGSASVGQTLRATAPTWTTPADKHTLSAPVWVRCAADGTSCTTLSAKLASDYLVQPSDAGAQIHVEYTATNAAGSVTTRSTATAAIAAKPVDVDDDDIPDELVKALGIPTGTAGLSALCTQYSLCKDDSHQSSIFTNWNSMAVIDGTLLDVLLGSIQPELLVANPSAPTTKVVTKCDGAGGNDVCVGNQNPDNCIAYIGDDFCLGNRGNDTCVSKAGNDVCYGGEGADACFTQPAVVPGITFPPVPKVNCLGGPGSDSCLVNIAAIPPMPGAWLPNMSCAGGSANDTCKAAAVKLVNGLKLKKAGVLRMKCAGDAGNDSCGVAKAVPSKFSSLLTAVCNGGTGNDLCVAMGAASLSAGIFGAQNSTMTCNGGPGIDTLWTLNGKAGDRITGGGQAGDVCFSDWGDIVSGCGTSVRVSIPVGQIGSIDGSAADQKALAELATATRNGAQLTDEQLAELFQQITATTSKLNEIQLSSAESMRRLLLSV